jgi:ligand-binding sensor domain-containing protein/signal transduction histidine kinase
MRKSPRIRFRAWISSALVILLLLATVPGSAQRKLIKQYVHDKWTTANGLPQNGADDILQTKDGYLWFGTEEGLTRFDGVEFTVFDKANTPELANSWIVRMLEDSAGGIWLRCQGASPGITRYANGSFRTYRVKDGLPTDQVNAWEAGPDGTVWLGTPKGLAEWKEGKIKTYTEADGLPVDNTFGLGHDSKGNLWISTPRGLGRMSGGKIETMTGKEGLPDSIIIRINGPTNIFEDSRGTIWMSSPGNAIAYNNGGFRRYGTAVGLPDSIITAVAEDRTGTIWFGTRRGLGRFSDGKIIPVMVSSDPAENFVRGIAVDKEGSLWLSTRKGIARYASGKFERFGEKEGLTGNDVQRILIDKEGSIWTGSNGAGVDRFRDEKFVTYSTRVGLSHDQIHCVFEDKSGSLWIGTAEGGLNRLKDGNLTSFTTKNGLPGNSARVVREDSEGNLWIMTDSGICTYKNGAFKLRLSADQAKNLRGGSMLLRRSGTVLALSGLRVLEVRNNGLVPYQPVDSLFKARENLFGMFETERGTLWLSTLDSIYRYSDGKLTNMTTELHLPAVGATTINEEPDGTVWLSIYGEGLFRIKDGAVAGITPKQGLFDYTMYSFTEDGLGYIWMSSNRGVSRINKKELEDVADGKKPKLTSVVYGTADGMESRECNGTGLPAGWRMHDGRMCFPTVRGVVIVNPADIRINALPPPVVVDKFLVEGEAQDTRSSVSVPAGKARFEFHYAGLSFVGAEKIRYKYQLEGLDKEWVDAGSRREAFYTHLDPGEYTFRVLAANSDGIWNETGASVAFVLQPHFYQTRWFLGLAILFFLTSGPSFYFNRMRSMKKRRQELEQQVKERTSELQKTLDNLKEMQNQLILSEKMASLGQLTAGIAHEIKNPLNFITNFAVLSHDLTKDLRKELAAERTHVDPDRAKEIEEVLNDLEQNVNKINEHGKRADSIVRGMLLHSRGKAGERLETDLNALLAEYTNLAYHGMRAQDQSFNIKIETDLDPTIGKVSVVPQDISRAFLNIVNNACYAANDKRKSAKNGFSPTVRVSARNLQDKVEIRIRDNGNGIPQSIREKVFNPFFTTKPAGVGTGLGLSLSYDIITQEHKGEISVDTKEGEYTEFVITLPKNPGSNGEAKI